MTSALLLISTAGLLAPELRSLRRRLVDLELELHRRVQLFVPWPSPGPGSET